VPIIISDELQHNQTNDPIQNLNQSSEQTDIIQGSDLLAEDHPAHSSDQIQPSQIGLQTSRVEPSWA
jgi:hypothetical protein